jgi:hypothetical protein
MLFLSFIVEFFWFLPVKQQQNLHSSYAFLHEGIHLKFGLYVLKATCILRWNIRVMNTKTGIANRPQSKSAAKNIKHNTTTIFIKSLIIIIIPDWKYARWTQYQILTESLVALLVLNQNISFWNLVYVWTIWFECSRCLVPTSSPKNKVKLRILRTIAQCPSRWYNIITLQHPVFECIRLQFVLKYGRNAANDRIRQTQLRR